MFIINITSLWYTVCDNYHVDLQQLQTNEIPLFSINSDDKFQTYESTEFDVEAVSSPEPATILLLSMDLSGLYGKIALNKWKKKDFK